MSFTEAVGSVLRNYATFSGRARRSEYWWFYLFTVLVGLAASLVDGVVGGVTGSDVQVVNIVTSLALLLPSLAVGARRLHDTGRTGWWLLLPVVPGLVAGVLAVPAFVLGVLSALDGDGSGPAVLVVVLFLVSLLLALAAGIVLVVFLCQDSQPVPNRYGPPPKQPLPVVGPYPPQPGYPPYA